jgi:hypothetical protein
MERHQSWRVEQYPPNAKGPIITIRVAFKRPPQAPDVYADKLVATADPFGHGRITKVAAQGVLF